jgi:NADH-quinone oxidoreductase subunit N
MTVFLLSLAGFPFTGGFIGKFYILRAAVEKDMILEAVILVLASLLSYYYYLRVAWYMWFRTPTDAEVHEGIAVSPGVRVALVAAVIGILWLGIFPGSLLEIAERSTAIFAQSAGGGLPLSIR